MIKSPLRQICILCRDHNLLSPSYSLLLLKLYNSYLADHSFEKYYKLCAINCQDLLIYFSHLIEQIFIKLKVALRFEWNSQNKWEKRQFE